MGDVVGVRRGGQRFFGEKKGPGRNSLILAGD